ncbi:type I restriction-modification system subunit M [Corynebacterium amycolatum]|uniref:type I restriction-modification system subunit M n=1 Tax=Corynebacterium amycolatum TaxID=43765 RepID=UPI0012B9C219|nr:class I SAM-dependent DNA methyltransferase [Corynebacterium amycolatum]KAA9290071.1 SAM-dependent DNA methyltransferase [Corynebacterium amycolatum]
MVGTSEILDSITPKQTAKVSSLNAAIWQTADDYLRLIVPAENYGDYIIPFTVLRRLEGRLAPTKTQVLDLIHRENERGTDPSIIGLMIENQFQLRFWNSSELSLERLANSDDALKPGMQQYLNTFSPNIQEIWKAFEFDKLIEFLDRNNQLWNVVQHFASIDMSDEALQDQTMGDIFENLMYRSFARKAKDAGEFYTPRDAIRLMTSILFTSDDTELDEDGIIRSVYDPTAGTCGMLIAARDALRAINPGIEVVVAGQELKESSFAMGKSDLLMQGFKDPEVLKFGNSLINDQYANDTFDYIMANPPYGSSWKAFQKDVKDLRDQGDPRFSEGLPAVSDGQMLFLMHIAHKLAPASGATKGGRAAVVTNGSPLFTGDAESGPDGIRKYLIGAQGGTEVVDAIIALPNDMFYNTGIATYIWILDRNKEPRRRGKIQFIDATDICAPMRKNMGQKRVEFTEDNIREITKIYKDFEENDRSIIVTADNLTYRDVPMFKLAHYTVSVTDQTVAEAINHKSAFPEHEAVIREMEGLAYNDLPKALRASAKAHGVKMGAPLLRHIMKSLAVEDENAPASLDEKGNPVVDASTKVIERVPYLEDVTEHMEREVLPFVPDVQWDESLAKVGTELPLTRLFYKPEESRSLEELDADIAASLDRIYSMFREVRSDD